MDHSTTADGLTSALIPIFMKQIIAVGFAATLPFAVALIWALVRGWHPRLAALFLIPTTLAVYAHHIEPRLLTVKAHAIEICGGGLPGTLRAAVVSDTHLGLFRNAVSMDRIAARISRLDADLVLVPGDLTYHPKPEKLASLMAPLGQLPMPVYAVMGNHDVGIPGPDYSDPLTKSLTDIGVTVLNPGEATFSAQGKFLRIIGLRDLYQVDLTGQALGIPADDGRPMATILLEHNPDAVLRDDLGAYELMVAGHTHGGQVYIPGVTCALTFACDTLRYGYVDSPAGKLFVTSGTGMVGLPIRFAVPPRIDVLDLTIARCPLAGGPETS